MKKITRIILIMALLSVLIVGSYPQTSLLAYDGGVQSKFRSVTFTPKGNKDEVVINIDSLPSYKITRITSPDRIVIDIPCKSSLSTQNKISANGSFIKSVRYAQYDADILRVVLDVIGQPNYSTVRKNGQLIISIDSLGLRNAEYHVSGDRVFLRLLGANLTENDADLKKLYTEKYESNGKRYTMTFPSKLADLDSGIIKINDNMLNSIQIINGKAAQKTSIIFDAKDKFVYEAITRPSEGDTAVTILKPASDADKLVVIDAGHGGSEIGAIYSNTMEKDLNLNIALKLNEQLKSKNVKTYLIRDDDSFVGLYERAYIANDLNAALFISVHNNAIDDPNCGGTMTLYYPQDPKDTGFNGKKFAQIIQGKLLAALKTTDRKIIERPNLVVLKGTVMTSALAEIAFMTNKGDLENLKKDEFQSKAATALSQAVIQALGEMK